MLRSLALLAVLARMLPRQTVCAGEAPDPWRYTLAKPPDGWTSRDFDDSGWQRGRPGFGRGNVHGSPVRTPWTTSDIWVRGTVELPEKLPKSLALWMHHDEDAEVYLNGLLAAKVTGYTRGYERFAVRPEARKALRPGNNLVAAHCRQTRGGQFLDIHVAASRPAVAKRRPQGLRRRSHRVVTRGGGGRATAGAGWRGRRGPRGRG